MKELVMKRRSELEDLCCKGHIQPDPSTAVDKTNALIDSGNYFCLQEFLSPSRFLVKFKVGNLNLLQVWWIRVNSWPTLRHKYVKPKMKL